MKKVIFSETQKIPRIWIVVTVLAVVLIAASVALFGTKNQAVGTTEWISALIVVGVAGLAVIILISLTRLVVTFNDKGIQYRYFPFHLSAREINWAEIKQAFVREYKPFWEYGGWGLRKKFLKNDWVYNVKGNKGLQLEMKDGSKILLGTQMPDEIGKAIPEFPVA
jgi:hypothetical protein